MEPTDPIRSSQAGCFGSNFPFSASSELNEPMLVTIQEVN